MSLSSEITRISNAKAALKTSINNKLSDTQTKIDTETIDEYSTFVDAIEQGGGSEPVIESLSITSNGTYTAPSGVDGYSPITVNVPSSSTIPTITNGYAMFYTRGILFDWFKRNNRLGDYGLFVNTSYILYHAGDTYTIPMSYVKEYVESGTFRYSDSMAYSFSSTFELDTDTDYEITFTDDGSSSLVHTLNNTFRCMNTEISFDHTAKATFKFVNFYISGQSQNTFCSATIDTLKDLKLYALSGTLLGTSTFPANIRHILFDNSVQLGYGAPSGNLTLHLEYLNSSYYTKDSFLETVESLPEKDSTISGTRTLKISSTVYSDLTDDEIEAINTKGYAVAS